MDSVKKQELIEKLKRARAERDQERADKLTDALPDEPRAKGSTAILIPKTDG
jgi:hypothetical protein